MQAVEVCVCVCVPQPGQTTENKNFIPRIYYSTHKSAYRDKANDWDFLCVCVCQHGYSKYQCVFSVNL